MYFPDKKNKRFTAAILITSILAILCLSILDPVSYTHLTLPTKRT